MKTRKWAPFALLALVGCDDWKPPAPPPVVSIPAYPGATTSTASAAEPQRVSGFAALRDRIVDRWLADDPSTARSAGLHAYDGKVAPVSAQAIAARLARVEKERAELAAVNTATLSADEKLDLALMLQRADATLFAGRDLDVFRRSPMAYEDLFSLNAYLDRDYAPIVERAEHLLAHAEAALVEVPHIAENLAPTLSKPVAQTGAKVFQGYADYLRKDLRAQLTGVGSPELQARIAKATEALAAAATLFSERLKAQARVGDDSHVLGPARYEKLLLVQEGLRISLAELSKMGEDKLQADKRAYAELTRRKVKLTPTKRDAAFADARRLTEAARRFILDKKLVTIPSDEQPVVKETPPYQRWNAAFLDQAGPLEDKVLPGFYYITLPDPAWPKKEQDEYLPPQGILLSTTIHEVYPGHFLHGLWIKRAPTRVQKLFAS
jgi:hypothetical protein